MYNEFSITGLTHSLANSNIIIETNFKLDPDSVNMTTVKVKDSRTGKIEDYTLSVDRKNIVIKFMKMPTPNTRYYVSVTDIKDALERTLKNYLNQTVIFETTDVKHKVAIVKPFNGEAIENNIIEVNVKATPDDEPVNGYYYEIASDVAFCNPITLLSESSSVNFTDVKTGQCFVRCRVQDINNPSIFGEWSDTISFIALNNKCNNKDHENLETTEKENDNPIIEDLLSLQEILVDVGPIQIERIPSNGNTSNTFYVVFDKDIDPSSVPDKIVAYRRDL